MKKFTGFGKNRIRRIATSIVTAVVLAAMIAPMLPALPARAADATPGETADIASSIKGTKVSNAYVLETSTGSAPGTDVSFILIKYKSGGAKKTYYLFPNQDSLVNGYKEVAAYKSDLALYDKVKSKMGYESSPAFDKKTALKAYETDQFYFTLPSSIDEVISIDAYMGKASTWACLNMRLFSVEEVYGLKMAGIWSSQWYIDFKGRLLADFNGNGNISWTTPSGAGFCQMDTRGSLTKVFSDETAFRTTQETHTYGFRIGVADVYKAGFEALYASYGDGQKSAMDLNLAEALTINVTYEDIYGTVRTARLPAIISAALWLDQRAATDPIAGLGLQGETFAFTGELPDCKEIRSVTMAVGNSAAKSAASVSSVGSNSRRDSREAGLAQDSDFLINCFAIYDMSKATFSAKAEGALIKYTFEGNPDYYTPISKAEGMKLPVNNTSSLALSQYDGSALTPKQTYGDAYLIQITTDDVDAASTTGDLKVRFNYKSKSGADANTTDYSVKDLVNEYYGYWPGDVSNPAGSEGDFAYRYGLCRGKTLSFVIRASNVEEFTGATLTLDSKASEYQFSSLKIYSIRTLGERRADWEKLSAEGVKSNLRYYRVVDGKDITIADSTVDRGGVKKATLILPGDAKKIDFIAGTVDTLEEESFDTEKYTITYGDAMQNFGFTKSRMEYDVTVKVAQDGKVAGEGGFTTIDSDAGSENLFYFQLCFEKGDSAFVLANQQLLGDRFQSGAEHTFKIYTNQDYGEINCVRVIPDDTSSNAKPYDKLKIDYIAVTEGVGQGIHKEWRCTDVGWVGIDFSDDVNAASLSGRKGRSLAQIAKTFEVNYVTSTVDIEFSLVTNRGDKSEVKNAAGEMVPKYVDQLHGKVWAVIYYIDNAGQTRDKRVDVVQAMYSYMGRTASGEGLVSDTNLMFREGHTDRFIVSISDVKQIKEVKFEVLASDYNYLWNIGGLTGKIVKEKGNLRINYFNEYEYEYPLSENPEDDILLTASATTNPVASMVFSSTLGEIRIPVTCSEIKVSTESGQSIVSFDRVPLAGNDTLNVYVFPSQGNLADSIDQYDLWCEAQYVHPAGMYYVRDTSMRKYIPPEDNPDGRRPMFYSIGLSAKNMLDLNHLKVKANSLRANMCDIEFAIVQQVRNNTVVATYYLDFNKMEVSTDPVSAFPSAKKEFLGYSEQQVVSLQFGAGTVTGGLYPQRQDIGVAIEYKSSFDPYGTTYRSPIVFLTDEDYNRVKEGQVCDLHFDQSFVGEITGIRVMSAGGINATIDRACAATYHVDSGDYKMLEGWYSFGSGIAVNNTEVTMVRTAGDITDAGTIMPISFKIRTASASESYESGTRDPVKATIYTVDAENNVITHNIPDLRKYIVGTDENFITGKEQEVRILLPGTVAVRRVVLEPVKGDGTGGWTIQTISAQVGDGDPIERSVGERIYENSPKEILFSNVVLSLTVQYYNPQRGAFDQQQVTNNTLNVISPPGQPVYVTPSIVGSEYGYEVKAVEVSADGYEGSNLTSSVTEAQGRYKFTPPEDTSGKVKYYRITVISKETKDTKAVVNITVQTVDGATEKMEENAIAELKKKYEDYRNDVIENKIPTLYGTYPSTDNDYSQIYGGIEGKMKSTNYLTSLSLDENKKRIDDLYTQLEKDLATKKAERDEYEKKKSDAENAFTEAKNQKLQELQNFDITPYTDAAVQQKADAITDVQNVKFNYDYDPSYEDEIKDIERIIEDFKNGLELKPTDPDPGTGGDDNNNG